MDYKQKADQLTKIADKRSKSWKWLHPDKWDEAANSYMKAGHQYSLGKNYQDATMTYIKAARCYFNEDNRYEAGEAYLKAGQVAKQLEYKLVERCHNQAVNMFLENGNHLRAAKVEKELASIVEEHDLHKAISYYEKAFQYYELAGQAQMQMIECLQKAGQLYALNEDYQKSIEAFEQVLGKSGGSIRHGYTVRNTVCNILLIHLVMQDVVQAENIFYKYQQRDPQICGTSHYRFLKHLVDALRVQDGETFMKRVEEYKVVINLDSWTQTMLERIYEKTEVVESLV